MTYSATSGPSGWAWVTMTVIVLLFVGLSAASYLLLARGGGRTRGTARRASAERRLADRFARGEIDEREYRHLATALAAARGDQRRRAHPPAGAHRRR